MLPTDQPLSQLLDEIQGHAALARRAIAPKSLASEPDPAALRRHLRKLRILLSQAEQAAQTLMRGA